MKQIHWQRIAGAFLLTGAVLAGALLAGCEDSSSGGVGFSVGLPTSYGSMELGMSTTNWAGGPFWN
ncbi:MAG TPA: hypothetical protein PKB14_19845 [Rubrivivax sp.]|nr:hypothetical protein [Rubrivivax sp.]